MKKICVIFCIVLMILATVAVSYADRRGGRWHDRGGFNLFIGPGILYPYPPYPAYPPYRDCERVCRDRVVPVCHYDSWGERWCHDEVVRDCRRECY